MLPPDQKQKQNNNNKTITKTKQTPKSFGRLSTQNLGIALEFVAFRSYSGFVSRRRRRRCRIRHD